MVCNFVFHYYRNKVLLIYNFTTKIYNKDPLYLQMLSFANKENKNNDLKVLAFTEIMVNNAIFQFYYKVIR